MSKKKRSKKELVNGLSELDLDAYKDEAGDLLRAFERSYHEGDFAPSILKLSRYSGLDILVVKKLRDSFQHNPKTSDLRHFLPVGIKRMMEIVLNINGEETTANSIAAFSAMSKVLEVKGEDITQSNTFALNVTVSESKAIDKDVEIRHFEITKDEKILEEKANG